MNTAKNANLVDHTIRTQGDLYNANLGIIEIAKRVRRSLKDAGLRASVRVQRYSMGQSLNIAIKEVVSTALKAEFARTAMTHAAEIANIHGARDFASCYRYAVETFSTSLATAYQRSESDSYTAYYNANFSTNVTFHTA